MGKKPTGDAPIEKDASKPPKERYNSVKPRVRSIDPRFDHIHGPVNPQHVRQQYAFLKEKAQKENEERQNKLRKLKAIQRERENEGAAGKKGRGDWDYSAPMTADDDDLLETVDPLIGIDMGRLNRKRGRGWGDDADDHAGSSDEGSDDTKSEDQEAAEYKALHRKQLDAEIERLHLETSRFKQQTQQERAQERTSQVKRDHMRKEMESIKAKKKSAPYFLKPKELKKEVERARFDELEKKAGLEGVRKFAEKKNKKSFKPPTF